MLKAQKKNNAVTSILGLLAFALLPSVVAQTSGTAVPFRFNLCVRITAPPDYGFLDKALEQQAKNNALPLADPNIVLKSQSMCQTSAWVRATFRRRSFSRWQ